MQYEGQQHRIKLHNRLLPLQMQQPVDPPAPVVHISSQQLNSGLPEFMNATLSCKIIQMFQGMMKSAGRISESVALVQETKWDAEREKACINTYAHASASQICLQNLCGQQQNSPMADPTFGSKSGSQRAKAKTYRKE